MNNDRNSAQLWRLSAVVLAITSVFSTQAFAANHLTIDDVVGGPDFPHYSLTQNHNEKFDSLSVEVFPLVAKDQYFIRNDVGEVTFEVSGDTYFRSTSSKIEVYPDWDRGTIGFYAEKSGSKVNLLGNIDAVMVHEKGIDIPNVGANLLYAKYNGSITLGQEGTTTRAWVLAKIPDLISAKCGGEVKVQSTQNQFVGSIDLAETNVEDWARNDRSSVTATFNGKDSYWYGDEHSYMNFSINKVMDTNLTNLLNWTNYRDGMNISEVAEIIKDSINRLPNKDELLKDPLLNLVYNFSQKDEFDLTFEDGAEWSYLGQSKTGSFQKKLEGGSIAKRISSIRLDGGVINLADEYLDMRWKEIGLDGVLQIEDGFKHDYVRIGDLKGSGGIFRIDLNGEEKSQSDMIFIESTSETAEVTHKIEPYKLDTLSSIANSDKTLVFALTQKAANNIKFEDKANYYGETLYDYEVEIASEDIRDEKSEILKEFGPEDGYVKYDSFNASDYVGGTAWFIKHVNLKQSTASVGMRGAGYASYDAAVQMDRHDRRIKESVFADGRDSGLWVRVQHGQLGAKGVYSSDVDTVYVGAEGKLTDTLRLGASFSYLDGDADFSGIDGSNDMERYEGSVYGTFESGAHYLDVVARFGRVNNDFYTSNAAVYKSGVFHQKYAALSAEYGYKFDTDMGFFVEPQVQGQATYLGSYDANVSGTMNMEADSTTSFIGRVGMRMGKTIWTEAVAAEVYARADVLHQFTDGQDAVQRNNKGERLDVTWGDAGTWYNYGVGGYLNWKDRFGLQLDLEKSSGGEVDDTWLLSGRLNYYF